MLDAAKDLRRLAQSWALPHPYFKVVQSAGGYGMDRPATRIPTGRPRQPALAAHETATSGSTGSSARQVARAVLTAAADCRPQHPGAQAGEPLLASRPAVADLRVLRDVLLSASSGRQPARRGTPADGSTTFWAALRGYITSHRDALAPTSSLLYALDAATPLDLAHTLFEPRFPRLY
jgi:hypothetical protein